MKRGDSTQIRLKNTDQEVRATKFEPFYGLHLIFRVFRGVRG
jgi:hypothetical protein